MSLISVKDLSYTYPASSEPVFEHVNLQLDTDWKLGFIGRNGRGKTTFLKLLTGKYEYEGEISSPVPFDYFPYTVAHPDWMTEDVLAEAAPQSEPWERMREINLLDLAEDILYRPYESLSKGEQTKVLLAALFLNEGHFLLIDEPTNHLDLEGRKTVSAYLNDKKGFILVSHDRRFLDGCVDHILSLNRASIDLESGNYSSWLMNFERKQDFEEAEQGRLKKEVRRMKKASARTSSWSGRAEKAKFGTGDSGLKADRGYTGHRAAKVMKRAKTLEKRQKRALEETEGLLKDRENAEPLKFFPEAYHAETLMTLTGVSAVFDGGPVSEPVTFTVKRGDRIVLDGRNGSGKSSLLKILEDDEIPHTGEITSGGGIVISAVGQDTSCLSGSLSDYAESYGIDPGLYLTMLSKLGVDRRHFDIPLERLSGGQRKKAVLARSLCQRAHLYIWDEPLNDLDIHARLQIEEAIASAKPTMILVEHDAAFRENVATKQVSVVREKRRRKKKTEA